MKSLDGMDNIHDNKANNISECNSLHDILNTYKRTKNMNDYCPPILHGCMNTRRGKARFKKFRILLDKGYIYMIAMRGIAKKLKAKEYAVIQWHTQAGNITTNLKVQIYFTL